MTEKYTPHVHAEVIKAWADGKAIEARDWDHTWFDVLNPIWNPRQQYRVKPEGVVDYTVVLPDGHLGVVFTSTIECLAEFYYAKNCQGFLKRTRIDGQVVSFEFIPK